MVPLLWLARAIALAGDLDDLGMVQETISAV